MSYIKAALERSTKTKPWLWTSENKPKMSTFSDNENFAASVSLDYDLYPYDGYYIMSFGIQGNPHLKIELLESLPTKKFVIRTSLSPRSKYYIENSLHCKWLDEF